MKLSFDPKRHMYRLNGRWCKGATSVAGYPDNRWGIEQWKVRQALIGCGLRPTLIERIAAHIDDKQILNEIGDEAALIAESHEASARGTAAHRIAERVDLGEVLVETPWSKAFKQAWIEAIEEAGLGIETGYVERMIVYPDLHIAGTFDRLVRRWETGRLHILDLKTGANVVDYPHSIAIQLAIYANAPLLAGPIPKSGGDTHQFEPMPPDVDKTIGYVIHIPEDGVVKVHQFDIAAGWDAFQNVCLPIIRWRERRGLVQEQISAATWAPELRLVADDGTLEPQAPPPAPRVPSPTPAADKNIKMAQHFRLEIPGDVPGAELNARINWIKAWIGKINDGGYLNQLAARWPTGVPTTRQGGWTNQHIDQIAALCTELDADHQAQLHDPDPTATPNKPKRTTARSNQQ